ncbi:MAG: polysulfide reductase NrfD [Syntrophorhabdaceae bacterium]|nr:polysulfide reductase NrfD [Syntrophorhabdaceae bacterium]
MIEKAFKGTSGYWLWLFFLFFLVIAGFISYLRQLHEGLTITGMGRDISWGLYIANFTFLVGIAASAVIVVLPYYVHDYKKFSVVTVLGEFLAVSSVIMTILFITVDLGMPSRILNVLFYPTPSSLLFWDMVVLSGYLVLNLIIGWVTLDAEMKEIEPPKWLKPLAYISIPWAISIHTVTAFIYSGLVARPFWHTALLAPRFLASAFASGPSVLVILCYIMGYHGAFYLERDIIKKLTTIITYALAIHIFFTLAEIYTVFYGNVPAHKTHLEFLFYGVPWNRFLMPWAWGSILGAAIAFILFLTASKRRDDVTLFASLLTVFSIWAEKGLGLVIGGFVPTVLYKFPKYIPTLYEVLITFGIYGVGAIILTILFKMAASVRQGN